MNFKRDYKFSFMVVLYLIMSVGCWAADWPCWRGPNHDGVSTETNINAAALKDGMEPTWTANIGKGYSAVAVAEGVAVAMGNVDATDIVWCFEALTGKKLWSYKYPEKLNPKYYSGGSNTSPVIADGKVYVLSKTGKLFCLDLKTGGEVWKKTLSFKTPTWFFAGSGLVVDEMIIFNVGASGLALNKDSGQVVWDSANSESGYATAVPFEYADQRLMALFGKDQLMAVDVMTGKVLYSYDWKTRYDVNAADPIVSGDQVFITSGYNKGAAKLQLTGQGFKPLWTSKKMRSQMSGPVLVDGYLYGMDDKRLTCLDWQTGDVQWQEKSTGKGSLMAVGDKLIVISEKGKLIIVQATPAGYKEWSSAQLLSKVCWIMPILANGHIYVRDSGGKLVCVDVRPKKPANVIYP